jgi:hypothetical protein
LLALSPRDCGGDAVGAAWLDTIARGCQPQRLSVAAHARRAGLDSRFGERGERLVIRIGQARATGLAVPRAERARRLHDFVVGARLRLILGAVFHDDELALRGPACFAGEADAGRERDGVNRQLVATVFGGTGAN